VEQGHLDLDHVQADEIRVKERTMGAWMELAMMVSTRRWLAGTVRLSQDPGLADALLQQVRRAAKLLRPLLVLTDEWSALLAACTERVATRSKPRPVQVEPAYGSGLIYTSEQ